jgi:hypothetical protein
MRLKSHLTYFMVHIIFNHRIFQLNLFNFVFWILVVAGIDIGFKRGLVASIFGGFAGAVAGIFFLGLFYALHASKHPEQFNANPDVAPKEGHEQDPSK